MKRRRPVDRRCIAAGCGVRIDAWKRLCDGCFRKLPFAQRKAIAEAGQAHAPHRVAQLAHEAARWIAEHSPAAEAARRTGEAVDG